MWKPLSPTIVSSLLLPSLSPVVLARLPTMKIIYKRRKERNGRITCRNSRSDCTYVTLKTSTKFYFFKGLK